MPDIAMCPSANCPASRSCRRHEDSGTKPGDWQTYAAFSWGEKGCANYWPVAQLAEPAPAQDQTKGVDHG